MVASTLPMHSTDRCDPAPLIVAALLVSAAPVSGAGNPDGEAPLPVEARAVDTSRPDRYVGNGTAGQLHLEEGREGSREGRRHPLPVRQEAADHQDEGHREGLQRPADVVLDGRGKITLAAAACAGSCT